MPTATQPPIADAAQRVEEILSTITLEEKVGQLFLVYFTGPELSPELQELIADYHVGGVVMFAITGNVETPHQVAGLINDAQSVAVTHGAQIPLFVSVDQEGGTVVRLTDGFTVFPSQMAVGATGSVEGARQMAETMAQELKALGFNMNLAPVLDVNSNPNNPVIGLRSFASTPALVSELGTAMIDAYRSNGMIATAKHFPGHGDTAVDSHFGLPLVPHDREHLESVEFPPFVAAIAASVPVIMTAHVLFPAIDPDPARPATLSPLVLQDLLREEMGFDGLIATDSLNMGALGQLVGTGEAGQLAFRAGADLLAYGPDPSHLPGEQKDAYTRLLDLVRNGEISLERLDASVRRILHTKAEYGLLDWQPVDQDAIPTEVGTEDHRTVAQAIAQASITLVRDESSLVPLAEGEQVLVVWPDAIGDLGEQLAACRPNLVLRPIGMDPTTTELEQILLDAQTADKVVVGTVNARRHPAQIGLVEALQDRPLIVAALREPYDLLAFPSVSTYLTTYGTQPASLEALARVLCGEIVPSGTLPVEIPGLYGLGWGLLGKDLVKNQVPSRVFLSAAQRDRS